jgi:hypothetical protein
MKAIKKLSIGAITFSMFTIFATGSYNSMVMNSDSFMADNAGISFTKRLDELNGKVVIGRLAASAIPWNKVKKVEKKISKASIALAKGKFKKAARKFKKAEKKMKKMAAQTSSALPAPAIKADLELELSNVFHKKPLKKGSFSGSAKTVDGVIEEIYVNLPGGKSIEINTRERMAGNVFQYEDPESREMKSGMFYEVKKGTYMITLTNDSQYPGARLEFKAGATEVAYNDDYYTAQESWELDQQNADAQERSNQDEEYSQNEDQIQDIVPQEDNVENFESNEFVENQYEQEASQNDFNFQT